MRVLSILAFLLLVMCEPSGAMTRTGPVPMSKGVTAAGFFGGIKSGTTLVLHLSEQGGLLYFRVDPSLVVLYRGQHLEIARLPLHTAIAVTTVKGTVTAVEFLKGE